MKIETDDIHICDDWISLPIADPEQRARAITTLQQQDIWDEQVAGLDSIAVQFDPALHSVDDALAALRRGLKNKVDISLTPASAIEIPVCYHRDFAPDQAMVAHAMDLSADELPQWHQQLQFTVSMIGFMPGFAYLECVQPLTEIGRLNQPRQKVAAGSIGLIGTQSCIYSFESPGGWPIIGRTPSSLFDVNKAPPGLLSAGQKLSFVEIDREEFDHFERDDSQ